MNSFAASIEEPGRPLASPLRHDYHPDDYDRGYHHGTIATRFPVHDYVLRLAVRLRRIRHRRVLRLRYGYIKVSASVTAAFF